MEKTNRFCLFHSTLTTQKQNPRQTNQMTEEQKNQISTLGKNLDYLVFSSTVPYKIIQRSLN